VILARSEARPASPRRVVKIAAATGGALYLLVALVVVMRVQSGLVPAYTLVAIVTALPVCAYLAFRYPLIFPFGLYVAIVPFDSLLQVSGGATISRLVAGGTAAAMILHAVLLRRWFVPHRAWYFWGAMTLYIATSLLWTSDSTGGIEVATAVVQLFLLMTILALYPATKTEFRIALGLIVIAGFLSGCYATHLYLSGAVTSDSGARVEISSANGAVLDFNYYAASFILPLAVALFFTLYAKRGFVRLASGASALVMLAGILLTGSRGALVAALAAVAYFVFRSKYRAQLFVFIALAGAVSAFFPSVYMRFAHDPSGQATSASGRTFIWETGLHSLGDHWLFGAGIGSYGEVYDRNLLDVYQAAFQGWSRPSHSMLVGGLTELGVVGLALVLATWYVSFRQMRVVPKTSEWYGLRIALEAAILGQFAMALTIDPTYIKYVWLEHSLVLVFLNQADPHAIRLGAPTGRRRVQLRSRAGPGRPLRAD
jgi:O-antigen ligase